MTIARPRSKGGALGFLAALLVAFVLTQPSIEVTTGVGFLALGAIAEHLADMEEAS